jgi:hypothetical protein
MSTLQAHLAHWDRLRIVGECLGYVGRFLLQLPRRRSVVCLIACYGTLDTSLEMN